MGANDRLSAFTRVLSTSASSINDTLSLLNEPALGGEKVAWSDVKKAAEQVAKHATTAGVLWSGNIQKMAGVENIQAFTESLQGFLLLCHGSTVGAGTTLLKIVHLAAKQVVDTSLNFLTSAVTFSGKRNKEEQVDLPLLVGCVWEACEAVKKTPSENCTAIGRSLTQVAASVKDVIRELDEFKQATGSQETCEADTTSRRDGDAGLSAAEVEAESSDSSLDFNDELSAKEMQVVQSVKKFISSFLDLLKHLLYVVADASKTARANGGECPVSSLERLLELSRGLGVGVDELGASLYPPQEIQTMKTRVAGMEDLIDNLQTQVFTLKGFMPDDFRSALDTVKDAGIALKELLDSVGSDEVGLLSSSQGN